MSCNDPQGNNYQKPNMKYCNHSDDEIDLRDLFCAFWHEKLFLILITTLFLAISVVYALIQPNIFRSQSYLVVVPTPFTSSISNRDLVPDLLLEESKKIQPYLNSSQFKSVQASSIHKELDYYSSIGVDFDKKSGVLLVESEGFSAEDVYQKVKTFSEQVNHTWKQIQLDKLLNEKQALDGAIQNAGEGYAVKLLEEKYAELLYKASVLESSNTELVTILEPAQLPQHHVKPKRALIVVLGTMLGAMLGIAIVLIRFSFRREGQETE